MRLLTTLLFISIVVHASYASTGRHKPVNEVAENQEKIEALNNYVNFINEGTHGLLIVVKLLENFNLDINKYVDMDSYQINNYSNDDLPKDIFEDPEHWFYEVTPYEWHAKATTNNTTLSNKIGLNQLADQMKNNLKDINMIRFDLEQLIKKHDLTQKENLNKVYAKLEDAVSRYEAFYETQIKMENFIKKEAESFSRQLTSNSGQYDFMSNLYTAARQLLVKLRMKDESHYDQYLNLYKKSARDVTNMQFEGQGSKTNKFLFNWQNTANAITNLGKSFEDSAGGSVNDQYKIYGKFYYFYNVHCISKFNRYGTGIVSGMNNVIENLGINRVKFTELPHYFKVIYPKTVEISQYVEAKNKEIRELPKEIKDRRVSESDKKIRVTSDVVEFLFFDHMIADGDIVSVQFNGEWIMEKEELEIAPKTFKIRLNKEGKNYLLLHADNVGQRPPCTIGVTYKMGNVKKEIILSSDLEVSEMIELERIN